jgi:hypothetical protein
VGPTGVWCRGEPAICFSARMAGSAEVGMGLSLVRCPFCDRRYNVTGIPPGTRVLCTSCRTVLTVPGNRFVAPPPFWHRFVPRSGVAQTASALCGGLILAAVCFVALKEAQGPQAPVAQAPPADPVAAPAKSDPKNSYPFLNVSQSLRKFLSAYENDTNFEIYTSPELSPFVLVGEKNDKADLPAIFSKFEDLLPKLYRTFMKEFGDSLQLDRIEVAELPIVFYTKRATYDAWWNKVYGTSSIPDVYGVFSYVERKVSLYYDLTLDRIDSGRTREVLLHEAIHQLVDHYTRGRKKPDRFGAWWFQEGLGNYFEGYYLAAGQVELAPGKMTSRLPLARELMSRPENESGYVPLKKLMVWTVEEIWKNWLEIGREDERQGQVRTLQCAYAESWALVNFLCHSHDGKYRDFFVNYFRSELEGRGGPLEFERLLSIHHPGTDLDKLEEQFKDFLRKL